MTFLIDKALSPTMVGLQKAMDLTWQRNEVISANIANTETPKYRAKDLSFGTELERAFGQNPAKVAKTDGQHLDIEESEDRHLVNDLRGMTKPDGNNVDMDVEMGQLAFNSNRYSSAVRYLRKEMAMLRYAIREAAR